MSRLILLTVVLGSLLMGCVSTDNGDDSLGRIQRNHGQALETAG
jgi:hypothetical protein